MIFFIYIYIYIYIYICIYIYSYICTYRYIDIDIYLYIYIFKGIYKCINKGYVYIYKYIMCVCVCFICFKNDYQQDSRVLYTFVPNKSFAQFLEISLPKFIFLKNLMQSFHILKCDFLMKIVSHRT